jgi:hypothetical protein
MIYIYIFIIAPLPSAGYTSFYINWTIYPLDSTLSAMALYGSNRAACACQQWWAAWVSWQRSTGHSQESMGLRPSKSWSDVTRVTGVRPQEVGRWPKPKWWFWQKMTILPRKTWGFTQLVISTKRHDDLSQQQRGFNCSSDVPKTNGIWINTNGMEI